MSATVTRRWYSPRQVENERKWERKRIQARVELAAKWAIATVVFLPLKLLSANYIPAPFDFTPYASARRIGKIRVLILGSDLAQIENDRHSHVDPNPDGCWRTRWFRQYSLKNLARYGVLDRSHVKEIERLLAKWKEYKRTGHHRRARRVNQDWLQYRETTIRTRFPTTVTLASCGGCAGR